MLTSHSQLQSLARHPFRAFPARRLSLVCSLFLVLAASARAQSPQPAPPEPPKPQSSESPAPQSPTASVNGSIFDQTGVPVVGAKVVLNRQDSSAPLQATTDENGHFSFANLPPGPFQLAISADGFSTQSVNGTLAPGQTDALAPITLALAPVIAEVHVGVPTVEIAQEQIREQEKQRALGFIPNYYVTYIPNAAPLNPRQKLSLAWKTTIDPVSFGLTAASAGIEQASDQFGGYGQGAEGFAKRYGASYADFAIGTFLGGFVFPSLLRQDPRYFYKGTGSKRSRVMYAIANAVICKGDNGRWQPSYSGIMGSIAAGGISNLYYPPGDRGASLIFENTLIGLGTNAAANILQEFLIRHLTPNLPNHSSANGTP